MTDDATIATAPLPDEVAMAAKADLEKNPPAQETDDPPKEEGKEATESEEKPKGEDESKEDNTQSASDDADAHSGEDGEDGKKSEDDKSPKRTERSFHYRMLQELRAEHAELKRQFEELSQKTSTELVEPREEDFADYQQYLNARDEYSREQGKREASEEVKRQQQDAEQRNRAQTLQQRQQTMLEQGRTRYPDFAEVALSPESFDPSPEVAQVILESEMAADVAYYLGSHPDEADRIEAMQPIQAAREIGRIEAKLSAKPTPKPKTPSAPDPVTPIGPGKDTPTRSLEDIPYEEYRKRRLKGK